MGCRFFWQSRGAGADPGRRFRIEEHLGLGRQGPGVGRREEIMQEAVKGWKEQVIAAAEADAVAT